jgi:hypothetical protein
MPAPPAVRAGKGRHSPSWPFFASVVVLAFLIGAFIGPRMPWASP